MIGAQFLGLIHLDHLRFDHLILTHSEIGLRRHPPDVVSSGGPVHRRRLRRLVRNRRAPHSRRGLLCCVAAALCGPAEPQGAVSRLQLLDGLSHEKREQRAVSLGAAADTVPATSRKKWTISRERRTVSREFGTNREVVSGPQRVGGQRGCASGVAFARGHGALSRSARRARGRGLSRPLLRLRLDGQSLRVVERGGREEGGGGGQARAGAGDGRGWLEAEGGRADQVLRIGRLQGRHVGAAAA